MSVETAKLTIYLLLAPALWALVALAVHLGRKRMFLLRPTHRQLPDPPPRATILIPAKDEEQRIGECVRSALRQDYANFKVIAINDRSSDRTGQVLDELAAEYPNLQVLHIRDGELPPGWTGKCNALHSAVRHSDGQWLLFVDSDVILQPNALSETVRVSHVRRYDMLSLFPRLEGHTFWENLLVPLCGTALSLLYLVALTNFNNRRTAFGNGQFLLIRRSAYDAIGGHESVRDRFCEDIEMARRVKAIGLRPRITMGTDIAAVRMYSSLSSIMRGWARIFFAASVARPWRIILGMVAIAVSVYSVLPAAAWGAWRLIDPAQAGGAFAWFWLGAAGVHWGVMTAVIAAGYASTGNARRHALLLPLSAAMLLGIFARALWMCFSGKVEWRGTRYTRHTAPAEAKPDAGSPQPGH